MSADYSSAGFVEYVDHMGDDLSVVRSARVSYGRHESSEAFDEIKDYKLVKYLLRNAHWSPLSHTSITFHVKCPIFVARQWMRHNSQSYNEISARYTELKTEFFLPNTWRLQSKDNRQGSAGELTGDLVDVIDAKYINALDKVAEVYQEMIEAGVARELARTILPVATYTEFYVTLNLRSLVHFLALREDSHAQAEIQWYANRVREIAEEYFPYTMKALKEV